MNRSLANFGKSDDQNPILFFALREKFLPDSITTFELARKKSILFIRCFQ